MIAFKGPYIKGRFEKPKGNGNLIVVDPGDTALQVGSWEETPKAVDAAVAAASDAYKAWAWRPAKERFQCLRSLAQVFEKRQSEIAELISREMGKPFTESSSEVGVAIQRVETTINEGMQLIQRQRSAEDGASYRFHPRGVLAIIGPFNFPVHLPNAQWLPALASGNTVVFKPSELTPFTGQILAECFHSAGFPPGVFNLVQGSAKVGESLTGHDDVKGVIFVGSDGTGQKILQNVIRDPAKICVLEMGGKNAAIIMPDAPLDKVVDECVKSALSTTGQRCNSLSRIIIHENLVTPFLVEFSQRVLEWRSGYYNESDAKMGPLVSEGAKKKFLKYQELAKKEDGHQVLQGVAKSHKPDGHYVVPGIHHLEWKGPSKDRSGYRYDEIFGPDVAVYNFKTVEEAIEIHNDCRYGLVASVFAKDKECFETMYEHLEVGNLHWNKGTIGSSPLLPFGGIKASGNHFPAGLFSPYYCTYPVALQTKGTAKY